MGPEKSVKINPCCWKGNFSSGHGTCSPTSSSCHPCGTHWCTEEQEGPRAPGAPQGPPTGTSSEGTRRVQPQGWVGAGAGALSALVSKRGHCYWLPDGGDCKTSTPAARGKIKACKQKHIWGPDKIPPCLLLAVAVAKAAPAAWEAVPKRGIPEPQTETPRERLEGLGKHRRGLIRKTDGKQPQSAPPVDLQAVSILPPSPHFLARALLMGQQISPPTLWQQSSSSSRGRASK